MSNTSAALPPPPSGSRHFAPLSAFDALGYAGPFTLRDTRQVEILRTFIEGHRDPGILGRALAKARLIGDRRLQQVNGHLAFRTLYDFAVQPQLLDDVEAILGPDILLWKGRIIVRQAGGPGQDWHVDLDNKMVGGVHITVAVAPMTRENGALQLIPKTHRYAVSLHESQRNGVSDLRQAGSVLALADATHPENAPHDLVTMELEPGQYFLTKGGLWHGVPPNRTAAPRPAMLSRYMRPDVESHIWGHDDASPVVKRRRSLPCILVRGEDRFRRNRLHTPPRATARADGGRRAP
jgi:non-haem Fe2+, alpha-ketoglutarate-dependent halogenase